MSVIELIHSMSIAEKRHFTLYVGIKGKDKKPKYVQLFNLINSKPNIKDNELTKTGFKTTDKNFLKEKIEESLHDLYLGKSVTSKLKWLTERMERNFKRAQWTALKKSIQKTKEIARKHESYIDWLQAIYWEKEMLTAQPESRQLFEKLEILIKEEQKVQDNLTEEISYLNLKILVNTLLVKDIRLSDPKSKNKFNQLITSKLLGNKIEPVSIKSKINYYHLKVKVAQYKGDQEAAYAFAKRLISIFDGNLSFKRNNLDWYKKSLCLLCDICNFSDRIEEIPALIKIIGTNDHHFKTVCLHGLVYCIKKVDKDKGIVYLKKIKAIVESQTHNIRAGRQLSIFYNGAVFLSLFSQWESMFFWIQKILRFQRTDDRRDLQYGARILSLMNYFELKADGMDNQIQAVANYYIRNNKYTEVNQYVVQSFRNLNRALNRKEMLPIWKDLNNYLNARVNDGNESTQQIGLGELSIWCISKIENVSMADVYKVA